MNIVINNFSCAAGMFDNQYTTSSERAATTHVTDSYELLLFDNKGTIAIGDESFTVESGMLVRLNPGETCRVLSRSRVHYLCFNEDGEAIIKYLLECPRTLSLRAPQRLTELIEELSVADDAQDADAVMIAALGISTFLKKELVQIRTSERKLTTKTMNSIDMAVEYMEEHFREKCSLNEVAAHVGRSPIYFHDTFEEVVGKSPCEYITDLRLREAKKLLAFTDTEPAEVAEKSGYGSQSYFNYAFKKALGITPLTYRRSACMNYWNKKG